MASDWTPTTVGSFCPFTYGKGLPEKKRNTNGNIKVYGSNGPVGVHDQPLVDEPGIVIGRKGTVGAIHFASEPFWPIDTTFYVVSEADRDLRYTYYLLKSIGLENMNADSAVPGLNRDAAHARQILVPEYDEQQVIAHILGSLDDNIELNRQMNKTLEAMAQAIFKSWFVDFLPVRAKMAAKENDPSLFLPQAEPNAWFVYAIECNDGSLYIGQTEDLRQRWLQHVGGRGANWTKQHPPIRVPYWERQPSLETAVEREKWLKTGFGSKWLKKEIAASTRTQTGDPVRAKAEGRDPSLPKEIAALFPDSFEDSELGQIPKGWEVGTVSNLANVTSGKRPQKRSKEETGEFTIPLYGGGGVMAYVPAPMISTPFLLTGRVGTLGKVFRITEECWPSDNTLLLFPNDKSCLEFLCFMLQRIDFDSLNRGSTQPLVTQTDLKNQRIVIPKESILIFYWQNVHPMFEKIKVLPIVKTKNRVV